MSNRIELERNCDNNTTHLEENREARVQQRRLEDISGHLWLVVTGLTHTVYKIALLIYRRGINKIHIFVVEWVRNFVEGYEATNRGGAQLGVRVLQESVSEEIFQLPFLFSPNITDPEKTSGHTRPRTSE